MITRADVDWITAIVAAERARYSDIEIAVIDGATRAGKTTPWYFGEIRAAFIKAGIWN